MRTHDIVADQSARRLDAYLSNLLPQYSRTALQRWIQEGQVLLNGQPVKASQTIEPGDHISLQVPETQPARIVPQDIPLTILYEDDDILAVDKPAGMVVHPAPGHAEQTLVNAVLHLRPDLVGVGGVRRPGIVHRLDKDTSGVILVAKNDAAHRYLQTQFKERTVEKTYLALVAGHISPQNGRIEAAIGRHPRDRKRMTVVSQSRGREAITEYETITHYPGATLVAAHPLTGRTHQIRVHFAAIHHPIIGDTVYGPRRDPFGLGRHFLHAHEIACNRPSDGTRLRLISQLPEGLVEFLANLAID